MKFNYPGVTIKGDVIIDEPFHHEDNIVIDGTKGKIHIREGVSIGKNTVIEGTPAQTTVIGEKSVLGENVRITGSDIGARSTLKDGVVTEQAVYTGDYTILEENTFLPKTAKVPSRAVVAGDPFSILRGLNAEEIEEAEAR